MITRRRFLKQSSLLVTVPGLLRCPALGQTAPAEEEGQPLFRFLFCNDIHVNNEANAEHFGRFIDDVNSVPELYDFMVVCGDMGQVGNQAELELSKAQLDRFNKPFYTVIGNHDVTGSSDADKDGYRRVFGANRENYLIEHKGFGLIFLDLSTGKSSNVTVPQAAVDWLAGRLQDMEPDLPLIVFNHYPLHPGAPLYTAKDADKLFELLDPRPVKAYFSGHWHGYWKGERNGVNHYCNACMSGARPNHTWGPQWYKDKWQDMTEGYFLVDVHAHGVSPRFYEYRTIPEA